MAETENLHCELRSNEVSNVRKVSNMFRSCNQTRSLQMYIGLVDWSLLKEKSSDHLMEEELRQ